MDKKSTRYLNIIIFFSLIFSLCSTFINNPNNVTVLIPLSILLLATFGARRFLTSRTRLFSALRLFTFFIGLVLIYLISFQDMTGISQIYFFAFTIDAVVFYSFAYSLSLSVVTYILYILIRLLRYLKWNYFDFGYFFPTLYDNLFYFVFVFIAVYIIKLQTTQRQLLSRTAEELREKTRQQEMANKKLRETMQSLEEITALKERNRIASEIHDTVGHTLTTVLIEIEAGKRLMTRNPVLACEKLELAQEQVRKGLNDIRGSVRALTEGSSLLTFLPSVSSLIRETEKHTGIKIDCHMTPLPPLTPEQEKILYRALQEGLTNGIRHGLCTSMAFTLMCPDKDIVFELKDNGIGCSNVSYGFGLSTMKKKVEELGGSLDVETSKDNGFKLYIKIPVDKERMNETDQNSCCG